MGQNNTFIRFPNSNFV